MEFRRDEYQALIEEMLEQRRVSLPTRWLHLKMLRKLVFLALENVCLVLRDTGTLYRKVLLFEHGGVRQFRL